MSIEQAELGFVTFQEAEPNLQEWKAALTRFVIPKKLREEVGEILSEVQMMLNLGEEGFSSSDYLELEYKVNALVERIEQAL